MKKHQLMVCPKCGRLANARVKSTNHPFHFVMSLLTLGFWLPIWLLCVFECMFHRPKIACDCATRPKAQSGDCLTCGGSGVNHHHQLWPGRLPCRDCKGSGLEEV